MRPRLGRPARAGRTGERQDVPSHGLRDREGPFWVPGAVEPLEAASLRWAGSTTTRWVVHANGQWGLPSHDIELGGDERSGPGAGGGGGIRGLPGARAPAARRRAAAHLAARGAAPVPPRAAARSWASGSEPDAWVQRELVVDGELLPVSHWSAATGEWCASRAHRLAAGAAGGVRDRADRARACGGVQRWAPYGADLARPQPRRCCAGWPPPSCPTGSPSTVRAEPTGSPGAFAPNRRRGRGRLGHPVQRPRPRSHQPCPTRPTPPTRSPHPGRSPAAPAGPAGVGARPPARVCGAGAIDGAAPAVRPGTQGRQRPGDHGDRAQWPGPAGRAGDGSVLLHRPIVGGRGYLLYGEVDPHRQAVSERRASRSRSARRIEDDGSMVDELQCPQQLDRSVRGWSRSATARWTGTTGPGRGVRGRRRHVHRHRVLTPGARRRKIQDRIATNRTAVETAVAAPTTSVAVAVRVGRRRRRAGRPGPLPSSSQVMPKTARPCTCERSRPAPVDAEGPAAVEGRVGHRRHQEGDQVGGLGRAEHRRERRRRGRGG